MKPTECENTVVSKVGRGLSPSSPEATKYADTVVESMVSNMNAVGAPELMRRMTKEVFHPYLILVIEARLTMKVPADEFRKYAAWLCGAVLFEGATSTSVVEGENADAALVHSAGDLLNDTMGHLTSMVEDRIRQMKVQ